MHSDILGPVDTAFYYVESAETPMNIGALVIFEGKLSFDALLELIDSRIHQAPLYQQRVVQAPLSLGAPTWAFDPDFHIGSHVYRRRLDPPGTDEQLRELAGQLVSGTLDRSKPLWQVHLIDGLQEGRSALLFKVHHCMVDGLSAVELFTILFDFDSEPPPIRKKPLYDPPALPTSADLLLDTVRRELPFKFGMLQKIQHDVSHLGSVLADKEQRRKALVGVANLINDNLRPIKPLLINGRNTGRMTLAWAEFSLAEVKAIRTHCHASVNDVMLTILGGAVGTYLRKHGERSDQDSLRVLVPVNMRTEDEKNDFGNRISVLPIDIPFHLTDPLERLRVVAEYTQVMKQSSLSNGLDLTLTLPALAPAIAQPLIWRIAPAAFAFLAHMWCTNVAGPQSPVYLLGHRMLHSYGFFPLNPSMGLATVITSYNQRIAMTLVADAGIVPDVTELKRHVEVAYMMLRSAANVPEAEPATSAPPRPVPAKARPMPAPPPSAPPEPVEAKAEPAAVPTSSDPAAGTPPAQGEPITIAVVSSNCPEAVVKVRDLAPGAPASTEPIANPDAPPNGTKPAGASDLAAPEMAIMPDPVATPDFAAVAAKAAGPNGAKALETIEALAGVDVRTVMVEKPRLFSEEWAQAYRIAINNSPAYYNASTRWDAGALAFIMKASPANGFPRATAVLLDLYRGKCRAACSLSPEEAQLEASFVIEGDFGNWNRVLSGKAQPLVMLMTGRLYLKKGAITRLLPFTQSAQELVRCAQAIS
jgi:diacylglycerol O-acyltransferase